jgi:hypothetical protein
LLTEIERFNTFLKFLSLKIAEATEQAKNGRPSIDTQMFVKGQVPASWKRISGYHWTNSTAKVTSHLIQRHAFIMAWMREMPKIIDASVLCDLRSFMFAFLADTAVAKGAPAGGVTYEFSIAEPSVEIPADAFALKGLYLIAGGVEDGQLMLPVGEGLTSQEIPLLLCKVVEKFESEGNFFRCPVYRTAFANELNLNEDDLDLWEGECNNFIWEVPLRIEGPESDFILTGTALFCRVPDSIA